MKNFLNGKTERKAKAVDTGVRACLSLAVGHEAGVLDSQGCSLSNSRLQGWGHHGHDRQLHDRGEGTARHLSRMTRTGGHCRPLLCARRSLGKNRLAGQLFQARLVSCAVQGCLAPGVARRPAEWGQCQASPAMAPRTTFLARLGHSRAPQSPSLQPEAPRTWLLEVEATGRHLSPAGVTRSPRGSAPAGTQTPNAPSADPAPCSLQ